TSDGNTRIVSKNTSAGRQVAWVPSQQLESVPLSQGCVTCLTPIHRPAQHSSSACGGAVMVWPCHGVQCHGVPCRNLGRHGSFREPHTPWLQP
ncbi:hypothetical protein HaLaN_00646, partial [Haematococcus lacustris]